MARLQINATNINEHVEHGRIVTTPSGRVQRRAVIKRTQLAHNDATIDKRLDGSRARRSELTQGKDRSAQATHRPRAASTHTDHRL
jgi:hypothetical protein